MMSIRESETGKRVDIRLRRILARYGRESVAFTVFCPQRRASRPLDDCRQCWTCEEIVIDPAERDSLVRCKAVAQDQRPPAVPAPWPALVRGDPRVPPDGLRTPVLQMMTRNVICVRADIALNELIMILYEHGISGAPVVDAKGKPLGVVSKTDLLRDSYEKVELAEDKPAAYVRAELEERGNAQPTVQEIMTTSVSALPESASIAEAAALMALEGVRRIPILDAEGLVVGIICASDILSWLARQAGYVVPSRFPARRY